MANLSLSLCQNGHGKKSYLILLPSSLDIHKEVEYDAILVIVDRYTKWQIYTDNDQPYHSELAAVFYENIELKYGSQEE